MKDSLAYRGSILWNLVNHNDKTTNVSFKELKKRLTARGYFKDFPALWRHSSLYVETQSQRLCVLLNWLLLDFSLLQLLLIF